MSSKKSFFKASAFIVACAIVFNAANVNAEDLNSRLNETRNQINNIDGDLGAQSSSINEVQSLISNQVEERESVESILETLNQERLGYEAQIGILNSEIQKSIDLLFELNDQIIVIENDIETKGIEIEKLQNSIKETTSLLRERLRVMYKMGDAEKIEILLTSNDINDFLSRNKMMTTITEYDQNLIQTLKEQKTELDKLLVELNGKKKALEIAKENAQKEKEQLDLKKAAQEELLAQVREKESENYEVLASVNAKLDEYEAHLNEKLEQKARLAEQRASLSAEIASIESEIESNRRAEEARRQEAQARQEAEEAARIERENLANLASKKEELEQIEDTYTPQAPVYTGARFGWPTNNTYVSAYFMDPTYAYGSEHKGIDIPAATGDPIYASEAGTVVESGYSYGGWGNQVLIDHGNGLMTRYAHMSTLPPVQVGQYVTRGQYIGPVGNTGYSFGSHLHYEVWLNGVRVDPMPYLR